MVFPYNHDTHHRRSVRLKGYDYAQGGLYFVTICTANRECIFGEVRNSHAHLNEYGKIVENEWLRTTIIRPHVALDAYVVMPNHVHAIVQISDCRGMARHAPMDGHAPTDRLFARPIAHSLPTIIGAFKSAATRHINLLHHSDGGTIWQRNYYEHIIRDYEERCRIRKYIMENPLRWELDEHCTP